MRIREDSRHESEIVTINVIFGPQPQSDHIVVYIDSNNFFLLFFQMATLNFNHILLMLADQGSILWDTLQSQDGLNLGDIHFCPIQ